VQIKEGYRCGLSTNDDPQTSDMCRKKLRVLYPTSDPDMHARTVKDKITAAQCMNENEFNSTVEYSVVAIGDTVYALVVTLANDKSRVGCK
jgi:hypothetical protein